MKHCKWSLVSFMTKIETEMQAASIKLGNNVTQSDSYCCYIDTFSAGG